MNGLQRIVTRQFNDLTQKRQSTQLKSNCDEFSSFDEPVSPTLHESESSFPSNNTTQQKPIKKLTNKLKQTFRRIEQHPSHCKKVTSCPSFDKSFDDECTTKNKTVIEKIRNVSSSQIQNDLMKLYKQAKIIDVRNGKLGRRSNNNTTGDNQNLLLFEELDSH